MIRAEAGSVYLNGANVTHWPMYRRAKEGAMGYLAQESSVFPQTDRREEPAGVMELLEMDRATRRARCEELLEQFNIARLRKALASSAFGRRAAALGDSPGRWSPTRGSCSSTNPSRASIPVTIDSIQNIIRQFALGGDRHLDHRPPGAGNAGKSPVAVTLIPTTAGALPREPRRGAQQSEARQYYFGENLDI